VVGVGVRVAAAHRAVSSRAALDGPRRRLVATARGCAGSWRRRSSAGASACGRRWPGDGRR
jgi:hypothetical protein